MGANSFGNIFKFSSFGESHGDALGVVIEGCPAGVNFDENLLTQNLKRRRPGQSSVTTSRNETDTPEVLSGVFENKTLGTPICILVRNQDQKSSDYDKIKNEARIGHADDMWKQKFKHTDYRGGGRSSGRETLSRVIAGSVARMFCLSVNSEIKVKSYSSQMGPIELSDEEKLDIWNQNIENFITRLPSVAKNEQLIELLEKAKKDGESFGGKVETQIRNIPQGLGQPVFHKFKADLASAMMSIGATISFELAEGVESLKLKGTEFHQSRSSSLYGGIRGGITTGDPIQFSVGFKPTSSIKDVAQKGRHDPCIVPRAVPVVESMAWLVIADHLLWSRLDQV